MVGEIITTRIWLVVRTERTDTHPFPRVHRRHGEFRILNGRTGKELNCLTGNATRYTISTRNSTSTHHGAKHGNQRAFRTFSERLASDRPVRTVLQGCSHRGRRRPRRRRRHRSRGPIVRGAEVTTVTSLVVNATTAAFALRPFRVHYRYTVVPTTTVQVNPLTPKFLTGKFLFFFHDTHRLYNRLTILLPPTTAVLVNDPLPTHYTTAIVSLVVKIMRCQIDNYRNRMWRTANKLNLKNIIHIIHMYHKLN